MVKKVKAISKSGHKKSDLPQELFGFARSERFINRELSWLAFNQRVLEEASNHAHPVLERLRFLSISASNLDEFFMVRVAGLVGQTKAGVEVPSQEGRSPAEQLNRITERANGLMAEQQNVWRHLVDELPAANIYVREPQDLAQSQVEWLDTGR